MSTGFPNSESSDDEVNEALTFRVIPDKGHDPHQGQNPAQVRNLSQDQAAGETAPTTQLAMAVAPANQGQVEDNLNVSAMDSGIMSAPTGNLTAGSQVSGSQDVRNQGAGSQGAENLGDTLDQMHQTRILIPDYLCERQRMLIVHYAQDISNRQGLNPNLTQVAQNGHGNPPNVQGPCPNLNQVGQNGPPGFQPHVHGPGIPNGIPIAGNDANSQADSGYQAVERLPVQESGWPGPAVMGVVMVEDGGQNKENDVALAPRFPAPAPEPYAALTVDLRAGSAVDAQVDRRGVEGY